MELTGQWFEGCRKEEELFRKAIDRQAKEHVKRIVRRKEKKKKEGEELVGLSESQNFKLRHQTKRSMAYKAGEREKGMTDRPGLFSVPRNEPKHTE